MLASGSLTHWAPSGLVIDGRLVRTTRTMPVIDPATEAVFAEAPDASEEDLNRAVVAARAAFRDWRARPWAERSELLHRMATAIEEDTPTLARILVCEQGKPLAKAEGEIASGIKFLRGFADMELAPEVISYRPDRHVEMIRTPLGVVGAITPWNYPVLIPLWKIGPALLTGNTVVLKPAPSTPLTALRLGEIARHVLPSGVLNVITGGDSLGPLITAHDGIDKISFTGSTGTGRRVMALAAATLKRVTLELGGNDPAIVLPDFDVESGIEALFWSAFVNSGQVCAAIKRLIVHESKIDAVCDGLARVARTVVFGAGLEPGVSAGPIQNRAQYERVRVLIEGAEGVGTVVYKGPMLQRPGFFLPLTIIRDVDSASALWREEPFGPILPVRGYRDLDAAIAEANDSQFGLGASVWGQNLATAAEVARKLDAGTVWTNTHPAMAPTIPFGGIKQSGQGVEFSVHGLAEYTDLRVVNVAC